MGALVPVKIIRVNGGREEHEVGRHIVMDWIRRMIGAPQALDTVNLRDGRVLIVDDTGLIDGRPVNPIATGLYRSVCRPGSDGTIHGDVAVLIDADLEEE